MRRDKRYLNTDLRTAPQVREPPISLAPEYESYVYERWEHGKFNESWKQLGIYAEGHYPQFSAAAMLHLSGW